MFDGQSCHVLCNQLEHVPVSHVHAYMQATLIALMSTYNYYECHQLQHKEPVVDHAQVTLRDTTFLFFRLFRARGTNKKVPVENESLP